MFVGEFAIDHPLLRHTLREVPDLEVTWEVTYGRPDGTTQTFFWATSEDFDAVDAAMDEDDSVAGSTYLEAHDGRRLYRVDVTGQALASNVMPVLSEVGAILQHAVGTADGWACRALFPDRAALETLHRFCRAHDVDFTFERLHQRTSVETVETSRLTDAQREILLEALEAGYLSIPRECTLEELGDRLGISESAASERFRRAVRNLAIELVSE